MNPNQFERRVAAVEKMLADLQNSHRGLFFSYATDEELDILMEVFSAIKSGRGLNGISAELQKKGDEAFARIVRRVKDSSRPHRRKLIPHFPAPIEVD